MSKLNRFIIDDLRHYYKRKGYIVIQLNKATYRPGFPELQILRRGICTFIKVLQKGQELTKDQCKSIELIKSKGFEVLLMSEAPEPNYKRKRDIPNPLL